MKIGITSPSAPFTHTKERKEQFKQGLNTIESIGFSYVLSPHAENFLSYVSDTTKNRLKDIHQMYEDPSVDIIVAANGGRCSNNLLEELDFDLIKKSNKALVGFSDTTVLLCAIYKKTGIIQIHGPMVTWGFYENDKLTNESFKKVIERKEQIFLQGEFGSFLKRGDLSGILVGGNLTSLEVLLGTPYEPDWEGKIFFWEDSEEMINSIDRTLTHFKNSGVWSKISGMVVGNLHNIKNDYYGKRVDVLEMIKEHFSEYDFPIIKTELFGHGCSSNISIPIGGNIKASEEKITISVVNK